MRFARVLDALANLPWWWSPVFFLIVTVGLAVWFKWKFHKIIHETVLEAGSKLKDATAVVHAVTAVERPKGPSPYDIQEDDEQFDPGLDGTEWEDEGVNYYIIEATITPADPAAKWDPTGLDVVPADFEPADPTDVCEKMGGLHSAEVQENGRFVSLQERDITGSRRIRFLFGIPEGVRAVKFAQFVTYFGHVDLPKPLHKPVRT
jgi:hypothetical protein